MDSWIDRIEGQVGECAMNILVLQNKSRRYLVFNILIFLFFSSINNQLHTEQREI